MSTFDEKLAGLKARLNESTRIIMIQKKLFSFGLCALLFFTVGCESEDDDKINQAQECLNSSNDDPAKLAVCKTMIEGLNSPEAKRVACSIEFGLAGLSNDRVIAAFEVLEEEGATANKEAKFMTLFTLNSVSASNTLAQVCTGTSSEGLEFIADAANMGTVLADQLGLAGTIDENTDIESVDVPQMLTNCEGQTACKEAIGNSAESMYDIYCAEADITENEVCADVNAAIQGGGTPENIGQTLIDLLQ